MPISAVLGPYVRGVWSTGANFWAELDRPCVVRIQHALEGTNDWHTAEARTVQVDQRHYAMVTATGLRPGAWYTWRGVVHADGATALAAQPEIGSRVREGGSAARRPMDAKLHPKITILDSAGEVVPRRGIEPLFST